jgi:hypothetical protein
VSARPLFEVADVFRKFEAPFLARHGATLLPEQRRVMLAIESCRTAVLGGHVEACDACDHHRIAYNSCGNRHCPKCQSLERARWVEARSADLLPVPYFHVVFTIPEEVAHLALQNKKVVYGILFAATAETLISIAADPKHLGAHIGLLAVLHTWGQTLTHHPHLHCIVPGGGLSPDRSTWISCRKGFFVHVKVLSRRFRTLFLVNLKAAFRRGDLTFHGQLADLADPALFARFIARQRKLKWVVYAKSTFGGPEQVLKYLGRYTHRVAISNHRITNISDSHVSFRWKDYKDRGREKIMTLTADDFMGRFLLHVLPSGFHRIRCYGFLANACRAKSLALIRQLLGVTDPPANRLEHCRTAAEALEVLTGASVDRCPKCKSGRMRIIERIPRPDAFAPPPPLNEPWLLTAPLSTLFDTS